MLLEEIIRFDKEKNFDRVIAAELAIALANKLNPIVRVKSLDVDSRVEAYYNKMKEGGNNQKSIFRMSATPKTSKQQMNRRRSKLFM
jgi:hypothetical protein